MDKSFTVPASTDAKTGVLVQHEQGVVQTWIALLRLISLVVMPWSWFPALAGETFNPAAAEWRIPYLPPKDPYWSKDWKRPPSSEARDNDLKRKATQQMRLGDRAKMEERYAEAVQFYERALRIDPTLAMASYQLACNYVLWGKPKEGKKAFDHAIDIGFADYASSYTDDELGAIRQLPDFADKMRLVRERYLKLQTSLLGQPLVMRPKGKKPEPGWPAIVLLHGYGDSNLSYLPEGEEWAKLGVLAIALPGSVPKALDGYTWSADSVEPTHKDIQATIKSALLKGEVDEQRVILLGFSQGAMHALGLIQTKWMHYAGVITLSPGGRPTRYLDPGQLEAKQAKRIYFIHGQQEGHAPFANLYRKACHAAGWPFKLAVHPGGHEFPEDWPMQRAQAMHFMLDAPK